MVDSKFRLALILCIALGIACGIAGCGDDDGDQQGTCEAICHRILNCIDEFPVEVDDFSLQACIAECRSEDPEKIACAGGCDAAPNCVTYAACLEVCAGDIVED